MFVLDDLYVSDEVLDFLENSQEPVYDNPTARRWAQRRRLNLAKKLVDEQERICALSEVYLEDIKELASKETQRGIELFKDKAKTRRALAPLFPEYVFEEYPLDELLSLNPEGVCYPVVVKPSTGFFSMGIYPIFNVGDWNQAIKDIKVNSSHWSDAYSKSVVNDSSFLVESYIEGEEYAVDAYFDEAGSVVVLNILKHDFAGTEDVSDRLYYTSKEIMTTRKPVVDAFLFEANQIFGLHDFCFHVELRISKKGEVVPIEFNPGRFAGLCTTDVAFFAYGFKTYAYFLEGKKPDWDSILSKVDDSAYTMILLTKPGFDPSQDYRFDYDAVAKKFEKVFEVRQTDFSKLNTFGMVFSKTRKENWNSEIRPILMSDLDEYITLVP